MLLSPPGYKLLAVLSPESSPVRSAALRPVHPPIPPLVLTPSVMPPPTPSLSSTRESSSSESVQEMLLTKTPTPPPADASAPGTKDASSDPNRAKKLVQARLQARQRELQEKIARTKAELAARGTAKTPAPASGDAPAVRVVSVKLAASSASSADGTGTHTEVKESSANANANVAKEESLRRLVLGSKRLKMAASSTTTTTVVTPAESTPPPEQPAEQSGTHDLTHSETHHASAVHTSNKFVPNKNQSLDDLAVSFIADALHSAVAHAAASSPSPTHEAASAPISTSPSPPANAPAHPRSPSRMQR